MDGDRQIRMGSAKYKFEHPAFSVAEEGLKKGEYRFIVDMDAHL